MPNEMRMKMGPAVHTAYKAIRDGILAGTHAPGAHLTEGDLASLLNVSRTPVREALRTLAAEGLVRFEANHGAFVSAWSSDDLRKIFDLRAMLESAAAGQAAVRMNEENIRDLVALADAMEKVADEKSDDFLDTLSDLNRSFHQIIMAVSDNQRLVGSVVQTIEFPIVNRTFRRYSRSELARSLHHHRELIDAFRVHDAEWAAAVMRAHVLAAKHAMVSPRALNDDNLTDRLPTPEPGQEEISPPPSATKPNETKSQAPAQMQKKGKK